MATTKAPCPLAASLSGRRFAVAAELLEPTDPQVRTVFDDTLRTLESLGARRVAVSLPSASAMNIATEILIGAEAAVYHEENLRRAERREQIDPAVRMYATSGRFYLATDYVKAQRLRLQLQAELEAALAEADVLVCPTDPTLTPKIGDAPRLAGRELMWFEYGTVNLGNLTGAPGAFRSLRLHRRRDARRAPALRACVRRAGLLAFGHAYEQATDWHRRRPAGLLPDA